MSETKRLHPIAAVIHFIKHLKDLFFPFMVILLFGGNGLSLSFWEMLFTATFIILSLVIGVFSWLRFSYRVEDGELRIESGVFVRKKRYIPFERIQSLDFSEGIFQRPFGLVKVRVETAGSSGSQDAEAVLTAISKAEATAIQEILTSVKNTGRVETEAIVEKPEWVYKITISQLLLLASTSGGVGVVISAIIAFAFQFDELIPYEKVFSELKGFISNGLVFVSTMVFLILLIAWFISVIGTMIKYADFTIKKVEDDLIISRGLLEKRQLTIPLNRVQGILICENLIRQPFGLGSVYLESAGGTANEDHSKALILPIMKRGEMASLLTQLFPDYHFNPTMVPSPKRALKRYMFRHLVPSFVIVILSFILFRSWAYLTLLLIPFSVIWAFQTHKDTGWNLHDLQLTLTYRGIVKNTIFMKKNRIQTISIRKSFFQQRQALSTVEATVKSGLGGSGGTVSDIEEIDSIKIYNWYKHGGTPKTQMYL